MTPHPRTLFIINYTAARARQTWAWIRQRLAASGVRFDAHETQHAGDATDATRTALRDGYQLIAAIGGDGTLSETAAGFFDLEERKPLNREDEADEGDERLPAPLGARATLAILPAGTGDDFARGLAGRREATEQWLEKLIRYYERPEAAPARPIDVIYGRAAASAQGFVFINVATLGIGAEVAGRVASQRAIMRRLPGEARFMAAACGALAVWRERRVRVLVDDGPTLECSSNLLAVANGIYAGGGMMFAPDARPDDGQMNLVLAEGAGRATILREMPRIRRGTHLNNPKVRTMLCRRVRIEPLTPGDVLPVEADGNVRGQTPAEFRIMPGALRIIAP